MTAVPNGFQAEFDENGNLRVSGDEAARLQTLLGHNPQPGEKVQLAVVANADERDDDQDTDSDPSFERWLRSDGLAAYDRMQAHPEQNLSIERVRANLAAQHAARLASQ